MHEIAEDAEGEDKWEVVSSDSVIQRRKLQEATDWPLSARGIEEKRLIAEKHKGKDNLKSRIAQGEKVDVSNEWSWDAEKESDISQWLGMPKEEFKQSHSFGDDSGVMSEVDIVEFLRKILHALHEGHQREPSALPLSLRLRRGLRLLRVGRLP